MTTGIIRRMDELGRIVIPGAVREALKIEENTPLVIQYNSNDEIVIRKYHKSFE